MQTFQTEHKLWLTFDLLKKKDFNSCYKSNLTGKSKVKKVSISKISNLKWDFNLCICLEIILFMVIENAYYVLVNLFLSNLLCWKWDGGKCLAHLNVLINAEEVRWRLVCSPVGIRLRTEGSVPFPSDSILPIPSPSSHPPTLIEGVQCTLYTVQDSLLTTQ